MTVTDIEKCTGYDIQKCTSSNIINFIQVVFLPPILAVEIRF